MLFHTHEFLALLIVTLTLFHLVPSRRHAILLTASLIFYAYAGLGMLALFVAVSAFAYLCLRRIEAGHRGWLAIGVTGILGNLMLFKYAAFFLDVIASLGLDVAPAQGWVARSVVLPVGISFYSFQLMAVLIDASQACRADWSAEARSAKVEARTAKAGLDVRDFRELLLFIMFFGHLIAGPIMRGREFFPQLHELPGPAPSQVRSGILLLLIGLLKKVVLADFLLAPRVDAFFGAGDSLSMAAAWLAPLLFGFQIYYDFSGYVDMALGMSKLFGLELKANFATPYLSRTPSEFWARWNITLSRWFADYVYVPLGGSRGSIWQTLRNVLVTMLLSGLWHGAGWTFLVWGAIHGAYLAAFHLVRQVAPRTAAALLSGPWPVQAIGWAVTYLVTTVAWVYFRAPSVDAANAVVATMAGFKRGAAVFELMPGYVLVVVLLGAHWIESRWIANLHAWSESAAARWLRIPGPVQAALAFPALVVIIALTKVVRGTFIYFQF